MKQTSDHANNDKVSGTKLSTLSPQKTSAGSIAPSGNTTSGSSQSSSRGAQGTGK